MRILGEPFYQAPLIASIEKHAHSCKTFIDIGASRGSITAAVWKLFERCLVVEPSSRKIAQLKRTLEQARNCTIIQNALSHQRGLATFYQSKTNPDDAGLFVRDDLVTSEIIDVTTLDELAEKESAPQPYLMKIDVQGAELDVFIGAIKTLDKTEAIIAEFWPYGIRSTGHKPDEFLQFMAKQGFHIRDVGGRPIPQARLNRICRLGEEDRFVITDLLCTRSLPLQNQVRAERRV
jgi:FkbM family methyltransferase